MEPAIRLDNVSYRYEDGTVALRDVSFEIAPGESVSIIGHNGSGKTTLFLAMLGILDDTEGISVNGIPVTQKSLNEVRRMVGYVFADPRDQLFMSRVVDDVAFGPLNRGANGDDAVELALKALSSVGLDGYADRVPYHLSSGEMRRAAIATVLAMNPDIIIMDEPSSGLDPRAKRDLAGVIRSLNATRLIASHDLDFIRSCTDRTLIIHKGCLTASGITDHILDNSELLLANGL